MERPTAGVGVMMVGKIFKPREHEKEPYHTTKRVCRRENAIIISAWALVVCLGLCSGALLS